ncbi:hypothetical protein G7Y41_07055 [Schaalia sp. ZJ405]|uniref:EndoU domain-containing protein n=1 Tax=Schaalia sp. ZJ405 TaxID=2709403 RepID=UPI0013EBF3A9|nr:EndoU domain-containing protein [Schaalia sp. ZJ405]QPK80811.1 hypothetical protein G7Y41_07055 [Schaalia sp. ZJ405]
MVDRGDVNDLTKAQRTAAAAARRDLEAFFKQVSDWPPEEVRDALLELMPVIASEYGDLAASVSAQWYDKVRPDSARPYSPTIPPPTSPKDVERSVRTAAHYLFEGDYATSKLILAGMLERHISGRGRETIARNTLADPDAKRFARVPKGKTCAFCSMLASRGFVYATEESAGKFKKFHSDCDCQIVPAFGNNIPHIEGYDPEALYKEYLAAREVAEPGPKGYPDEATILAAMRTQGGDKYTDSKGVKRNSTKPRKLKPALKDGKYLATPRGGTSRRKRLDFGPEDVKLPEKVVDHILYGNVGKRGKRNGGHLFVTVMQEMRESQIAFPKEWDSTRIANVVQSIINRPEKVIQMGPGVARLLATIEGVEVVVQLIVKKNRVLVSTAHPMRGQGVMRVHNGHLIPVE